MSSTKRTSIFAIILVVTAIVPLIPLQTAFAQQPPSIGCDLLNVSFIFDWHYFNISISPVPMNANELITLVSDYPVYGGPAPTMIELWIDGSQVAWDNFPGTITYTIPATDSYALRWFNTPMTVETTWDVECSVMILVLPTPGPDMVLLPAGSVVGAFVDNAMLLYEPDDNTPTGKVMTIGKTLWVTGLSADRQFYQVVLSGLFLWVPVESMGPNYDEVWRGTPLPTEIVEVVE